MSLLVSARLRERSHRPALRIAGRADQAQASGPGHQVGEHTRERRAISGEAAPVLLAGADARGRARLRSELGATLPARTRFCEAGEVTEVLEQAPGSRLVILTGDLEGANAESLVRMLGRRHPQLPVVCVGEPAQTTSASAGRR